MDPITIIELIVIIAIIICSMLIIKWVMDRYKICGVKDPLCYITGEKTSAISIINSIF